MRIHCTSLATDDLPSATKFYQALLPHITPETSDDLTVFFFPDKTSLVLYPRKDIENHTKISAAPSPNEVILTYFCRDKAEVESVLALAEGAGAKVTDPLTDQPWGYSVIFLDPDGHAWELNYNPNVPI